MIKQIDNIEHRKLTKKELDRLIIEAEPSETKFLRDLKLDIYNFFKNSSVIEDGLVIDGRPIYIAALVKNDERLEFWTVVNKDTGCIIQLSRHVRDELKKWLLTFGTLYATMEKVNPKNMKWVEWLGFKILEQDDKYITYKIGD